MIEIRAREPGDAVVLTELLNQPRVIWGTLQLPHTSLAARQKQIAESPPGHTFLVALLDGVLAGTAGLHPADNRRRAHSAGIGMAVHDAHAGRGVGTALLAALLDKADNWLALRRVELTVWTDNTRAIALYERFGFEREGVARAYAWREGRYVDALTMARLRL